MKIVYILFYIWCGLITINLYYIHHNKITDLRFDRQEVEITRVLCNSLKQKEKKDKIVSLDLFSFFLFLKTCSYDNKPGALMTTKKNI